MRHIDNETVARDLEALRSGEMGIEALVETYCADGISSVLDHLWHNMDHYLADADIRANDAEYASMQNAELSKLSQLIREQAPDAQLQQVHFLGRSRTAAPADGGDAKVPHR